MCLKYLNLTQHKTAVLQNEVVYSLELRIKSQTVMSGRCTFYVCGIFVSVKRCHLHVLLGYIINCCTQKKVNCFISNFFLGFFKRMTLKKLAYFLNYGTSVPHKTT
jgi:hypothetical protein